MMSSGVAGELRSLLPIDWKPCFDPPLFAFGIVRHVFVSHRHQSTGSVFAGVSMGVGAVRNDIGIFVRQ